jgi:oligopeptide/dipeptide ABC transporter ATP-binding protein
MPYTWGLLSSIPRVDDVVGRRLLPIPGAPPLMSRPPAGCRFSPRCAHMRPGLCDAGIPELVAMSGVGLDHEARCARLSEPDFASNAPVFAAAAL